MASDDPSQAERSGEFHSPLGANRLVLNRFIGTEFVNDMFDFRVEASDTDPNVDFDALLGQKATVKLYSFYNSGSSRGTPKIFNGVITEASYLGNDNVSFNYGFRLRPWLWLLSLRENNRIFHEKSVIDIVKQVFEEYPLSKVQVKVTKTYEPIHYTVQFGETDLNFVFRMLERHGINYHFEYAEDGHTMVLSDDKSGFQVLANGSRDFIPVGGGHGAEAEHFWTWNTERQMTTGTTKMVDYNMTKPSQKMDGTADGGIAHQTGKIEVYRYPGKHEDSGEATKVAQVRIDQFRSRDHRFRAQGDVMSLSAGQRMTLSGNHPDDVTGKEYICLRATHSFVNNEYGTGTGGGARYTGDYGFYESSRPLAPEMRAKARVIEGPQTARVVGAKGSEIDCDEYGRILVRFHWDLDNAYSMRCRCAQMWAHNGWGSMFIPRIDMEVVVVFIDGDPERPLVVGCVYNGNNDAPWKLPGKKNIAGIKSRSTMKGGTDNFNELSFDDTKGSEIFNQQAERDMTTLVKRNETRDVWVDRKTTIGQDEERLVKRDEKHTIKGDSTWEVVGKHKHTVKGDRITDITTNDTLKVASTLKVSANTKIELKCGASKITMTPTKITIKSVQVEVKGDATLKTSSPMSTHEGTAMQTIKGGMVFIN